MSKITTVSSATAGGRVELQGDAKGSAAFRANLHKVAKEFETVMVHQLLEAAKLGGEEKDSGYKGMVVDAAASGISEGGGLGLAKQIEDALARAR
jgi:Rod binding domain-containing protein